MAKVIYISNYCFKPFGDGGFKRTSQIYNLLTKGGYEIEFKKISFTPLKPSKIKKIPYIFYRNGVYRNVNSLTKKYNIHQAIKYYKESIKDYDIILLDFGVGIEGYDFLLPEIVNELNKKIIAICHNLDSLVPEKKPVVLNKISNSWLNKELEYLSKCDFVITISREENWLLNLHKINSIFIPYNPEDIPELYNFLLTIKEKRKEKLTSSSYLLILGTVLNPPTYSGMFDLLKFLKSKNYPIKVAGFGTESFQEFNCDTISILGSVDQNQLEELLVNCKAVIINTQWSSGALTKIPELLLCNIPIIANESAARTFYNNPSIFEFRSLEELVTILDGNVLLTNQHSCRYDYSKLLNRTLITELYR